ncbi:hypothetical protein ACVIHI_008882 [Bradyrhizobium sp. USDA 4524]|nr:hypothetical protein [Bradyrhizobium sp. USDA 4538]MCP1907027.1 hypothetical protein [Bradyrhizobium sp. USDA 4537]MCP1985503.1 hypothetical protein [Bradyrhizobium sp. USDA 4539]
MLSFRCANLLGTLTDTVRKSQVSGDKILTFLARQPRCIVGDL